jgi:MtN3 and saliva related transmembrane protein
MNDIDGWQLMGSVAAIAFTLGFFDQLRLTLKTRNVEGLSMLQWCVFASASAIFTAYYGHLDQWLMLIISVLGTLVCLSIVGLIFYYKEEAT